MQSSGGCFRSSGDASQSLDFYAVLVKSHQLLRSLVTTEYQFSVRDTVTRATLVSVYEIEKNTEALAQAAAVERLRNNYQVSIDTKSGLVTLRVITGNPELTTLVAHRALALVNEFNLDTRQSQAKQERLFVQERLVEVEGELRIAEDSLEAFLERNRQFRGAPELVFQHERLQRRVAMRQQVFTSLSQAYEQARVEEVRNTPVITTFEEPVLPVKPDSRRFLVRGLIGLVVGVLVAFLMAFGFEIFEQGRRQAPEQADRLRRLREETMKDILRPWRVFQTGKDPSGG